MPAAHHTYLCDLPLLPLVVAVTVPFALLITVRVGPTVAAADVAPALVAVVVVLLVTALFVAVLLLGVVAVRETVGAVPGLITAPLVGVGVGDAADAVVGVSVALFVVEVMTPVGDAAVTPGPAANAPALNGSAALVGVAMVPPVAAVGVTIAVLLTPVVPSGTPETSFALTIGPAVPRTPTTPAVLPA